MAAAGWFVLAGNAGAQASFPYNDGFESGSLGPEWTATSDPNGEILVTTAHAPHDGAYHVTMDCINSGTYALNTLDLNIDLTGQTDAVLTYWYKEYGDEDDPEDGCFISDDGINFYLVNSHNGGPSSWTMFTVDIGAAAASYGLTMGNTFVIRFSQYDNSPLTSDGICIDDVKVDRAEVPSLSCDVTGISASAGGVALFTLDAGTAYAGREYLLLGTASGTAPGISLPGGAILPLNPGFFFHCVRTHVNNANFVHFNGTLDAVGGAFARMDSRGPINPALVGKHLDFAYTTVGPYDFQSETVGIDITP